MPILSDKSLYWNSHDYCTNTPFFTQEIDNKKIILFDAKGIPEENIKHNTEFINRTCETYLVIQGEHSFLNYKNCINVRYPINTSIYNGYEVKVNDGLVMVILHEIENKKPVLKDYSMGYRDE